MATASTLRTLRVGGQLDPAWLTSSIPWTHVRATATLSRPDDGAPIVDPTNGAHEHPLTTVETLTAAQADGQWRTTALKPTTSTGADLALQPTGLTWTVTLEIKRGATWHEVIGYEVAPSGDRDYSGLGETVTVAGATCIDVNALIPPPTSLPPGDAFEAAVLEVLTDNPAAIAADLSVSRTSTTVTVASSTGTDAVLPAATTSLAGQLTADDKTKLDGIAAGAQVNVATNLSVTRDSATVTVASSTGSSAVLPAATTSLAGQLTAADKTKLDATSGTNTGDRAPYTYAYLKTTLAAVSTVIQADYTAGRLAVGDTITTAAYYQGSQFGGATYTVVASGTGTDDGGTFITFTGFQLRAVFGDSINVAQFGVLSTRTSAQNVTAIHAAVAAAGTLGIRTVTVPEVVPTQGIGFTGISNITLRGPGGFNDTRTLTGAAMPVLWVGNSSHITIDGLQLQHANASVRIGGCDGLTIAGGNRITVKNCRIGPVAAAGILVGHFGLGFPASHIRVINNRAEDTLADGIHFTSGTSDALAMGNIIINPADDGVACVASSNLDVVTDVRFIGNHVEGGSARGITVVGGNGVVVSGNTIRTTQVAGIYIATESAYDTHSVTGVSVTGNTIIDACQTGTNDHGGIYISSERSTEEVTDVEIVGNTILDSGEYGIKVGAASSSAIRRFTLTANTITGSGKHGIQVLNALAAATLENYSITGNIIHHSQLSGIAVNAALDGLIKDNTISDSGVKSGTDSTPTGRAGIRVEGTTQLLDISGNRVVDNTSGYVEADVLIGSSASDCRGNDNFVEGTFTDETGTVNPHYRRNGTTAQRPVISSGKVLRAGTPYFDSTLGHPIYVNAARTGWVDATGTSV